MGYEEILGVNPFTAVFALLNAIALFLVLKKFLFKPIEKVMEQRQAEVDQIYDDAESAKADAEAYRAAYDEKLASAKEEAVDIIKAAQERADRLGDEIVSDAKAKADDMIKRADAEIAQERKKAVNELKNEISFISIGIAEKMLDREINEGDHEELINRFIDEMGEDDE